MAWKSRSPCPSASAISAGLIGRTTGSVLPEIDIGFLPIIGSIGAGPSAGRVDLDQTNAASQRCALFFAPGIPLLDQSIELILLLSDALRRSLFVPCARRSRGLFGQLPDIVAQDSNAVVELGQRENSVIVHVQGSL